MIKISGKKLILIGLILFCLSTILQSFFWINTSVFFILASFILLGMGWGTVSTPATAIAIASTPHHFAGTATGVLWSTQNASSALSIAVILTLFRKTFEAGSTPESFMAGYHLCMWVLSAITFVTILFSILYMKSQE